MKILSVLAMTAALVATGASAQGFGSDSGTARQRDTVVPNRSDVRHPTKAQERVAGQRGSGSFATAPAARPPSERPRAASTAFDGNWSVLILTESGPCDRAYRYGVQISNGEVLNAGGEPIALAGRVAPNGTVQVIVAAGDQEARGVGRLSQVSGGGTWQGQGSRGACAGTWQAERRG